MTKYRCPICNKRACDSNKRLSLARLSASNLDSADVFIKCQSCKNTLAVTVDEKRFMGGEDFLNQTIQLTQSPCT